MENEPHLMQYRPSKIMESDYLGLGYSLPHAPWLDVRVFYVRVSFCALDDSPEILTIRYGGRHAASNLEVNGNRVPATEEVALVLRRDRMDAESSEATYVGTDRLRTTGSLNFEISHKEETLIKGAMEKSDIWLDGQGLDRIGTVGTPAKSQKSAWIMDCKCTITSSRCIFLKRRGDNSSVSSPSMEVYVAGRYAGAPVILTQTVELAVHRKPGRWNTLYSIPEVDESEKLNSSVESNELAHQQVEERKFYQELDNKPTGLVGAYGCDNYLDSEEGEITWFNAGVRVGVGLGLGMCVGLGIGVGLMMRAYQSTTRTLRRFL